MSEERDFDCCSPARPAPPLPEGTWVHHCGPPDLRAICGAPGRYSGTNGWDMVDCPACLEIGPDAATWSPGPLPEGRGCNCAGLVSTLGTQLRDHEDVPAWLVEQLRVIAGLCSEPGQPDESGGYRSGLLAARGSDVTSAAPLPEGRADGPAALAAWLSSRGKPPWDWAIHEPAFLAGYRAGALAAPVVAVPGGQDAVEYHPDPEPLRDGLNDINRSRNIDFSQAVVAVPEAGEGHHPRCFQSMFTGEELEAKGVEPDQCDCRTLRMIDAAQCPNGCGPGFACSDCPSPPPTREQLIALVDSLLAENEQLDADNASLVANNEGLAADRRRLEAELDGRPAPVPPIGLDMTIDRNCQHEQLRLIWRMNPRPAAVECLDCLERWSLAAPVVGEREEKP